MNHWPGDQRCGGNHRPGNQKPGDQRPGTRGLGPEVWELEAWGPEARLNIRLVRVWSIVHLCVRVFGVCACSCTCVCGGGCVCLECVWRVCVEGCVEEGVEESVCGGGCVWRRVCVKEGVCGGGCVWRRVCVDIPLYMEAGDRRDPEVWGGGLDMDMGR